jgi:group I intron endonuclease
MQKPICGIYIIKNDVNSKVYIGQSVDIVCRYRAHQYSGSNPKAQDAHLQIHKAMNNIGVSHFWYEILEECELEKLDEREIFYIALYDSYEHGYNMTLGGSSNRYETNGRALLTQQDVYEIRLMYNAHIPFREAFKKYSSRISKRGFQKIWRYETWRGILPEVYSDENLLWHATAAKGFAQEKGVKNSQKACSKIEIDKIRELFSEGKNYREISAMVHRSISVVRKYCLHLESDNPDGIGRVQKNSISIRNLETGLVFKTLMDACRWAGIKDSKHLSRIVKEGKKDFSSGTIPLTGERAHWELA